MFAIKKNSLLNQADIDTTAAHLNDPSSFDRESKPSTELVASKEVLLAEAQRLIDAINQTNTELNKNSNACCQQASQTVSFCACMGLLALFTAACITIKESHDEQFNFNKTNWIVFGGLLSLGLFSPVMFFSLQKAGLGLAEVKNIINKNANDPDKPEKWQKFSLFKTKDTKELIDVNSKIRSLNQLLEQNEHAHAITITEAPGMSMQ